MNEEKRTPMQEFGDFVVNGPKGNRMKTSELKGAALDWAVAKCEKLYCYADMENGPEKWAAFVDYDDNHVHVHYTPSQSWGWGGPIIEREKIDLVFRPGDKLPGFWDSYGANTPHGFSADTPLIAAMRCFVASKLGDEVDVPEELK